MDTPFFVIGGMAYAAENVALEKTASQSSEHPRYKDRGWTADKVVDGNTDGDISKGSVNYTNPENQPWWQVDLGAVYHFDMVSIWNRTDGNQDALSDFYIFVSNENISLSHSKVETILEDPDISAYYVTQAGTQIDIEGNFSGRFVRIQLKAESENLNLAELAVWTDLPPSCGIEVVAATLSPELNLHIPEIQYDSPFGTVNYWADLEYVGERNGDLLWKLSDYGQQ